MDRFQKWYTKHHEKLTWWTITDIFEKKGILVCFTDDEDNMDGVQDVVVIQKGQRIQHFQAVLKGQKAERQRLKQHNFKGLKKWDNHRVQAVQDWTLENS